MFGVGKGSLRVLTTGVLVACCAVVVSAAPSFPRYAQLLILGSGTEWRFRPLVIDLDGDGHLDLAATARLGKPSLQMWLGDGKGNLTPIKPTWTDIGYAALATSDINGDGFPDIVGASHFGRVQTLLSDGRGGFTETTLRREDGYVGAQLAELNGDGHLDLIVLGFQKAGIEIYFGDRQGNWKFHATLPETRPGRTMPGRALVVGDLDHDGHLDLVVAFQRWGVYVYYGDGRGGFVGGPVDFSSASRDFGSLALGDVNHDGHLDIAINGTSSGGDEANGPDVYLGDGRRGWKASSTGLKVLRLAAAGIALGDLDPDGNVDIVAAGSVTGNVGDGYGLFYFRGDGQGGWRLVEDSGVPARGLPVLHSVALADLDRDSFPEIIALGGGHDGSITIWRRKP